MKANADAAVEEEPAAKKAAAMPPKGGVKGKAKAGAAVEESAAAAVETERMQIKVNDCVRKISGVDKGQEGVVVEVLDDGDVRVEYKSGENTCRWIKQSANNFEKLAPADDHECLTTPALADDPQWPDGLPKEFARIYKGVRRSQMFVLEHTLEGSRFTWGGELIASKPTEFENWAKDLEKRFPPKFNGTDRPHWHPSETLQYRTRQCKAEVSYCWEAMDQSAIPQAWKKVAEGSLPEKILDAFRVDLFGNVVSNKASAKAVCAFEVDHVFPWSRGGCSRQSNFAGLYWGANVLKREKLIQGAELSPCPAPAADSAEKLPGGCRLGGRGLQMGLSVATFISLFQHTRAVTERGADRTSMEDIVVGWLTAGRPLGQSKADLQKELGLKSDSAPVDVWASFERWDDRSKARLDSLVLRARAMAKLMESSGMAECGRSPTVDVTEDGELKVRCQEVRVRGDSVIAVARGRQCIRALKVVSEPHQIAFAASPSSSGTTCGRSASLPGRRRPATESEEEESEEEWDDIWKTSTGLQGLQAVIRRRLAQATHKQKNPSWCQVIAAAASTQYG